MAVIILSILLIFSVYASFKLGEISERLYNIEQEIELMDEQENGTDHKEEPAPELLDARFPNDHAI